MPFSSSAEASGTYGDLSYTTVYSDGDGTYDYVEIIDCNESVTEIEIPAEIEGLPVKSLNSNILSYCKKLKSIHVSESNNYYCSAKRLTPVLKMHGSFSINQLVISLVPSLSI